MWLLTRVAVWLSVAAVLWSSVVVAVWLPSVGRKRGGGGAVGEEEGKKQGRGLGMRWGGEVKPSGEAIS